MFKKLVWLRRSARSTQQKHSCRVHDVRPKVFNEVHFLVADLAERMLHKGITTHQIGSAVPASGRHVWYFLLQRQKESRGTPVGQAKERKEHKEKNTKKVTDVLFKARHLMACSPDESPPHIENICF